MNKIDQINALFDASNKDVSEIEEIYNASLAAKKLDPTLSIKIKNLLENLRSALDYIAKGIFDKYCSSSKKISVYFPILNRAATNTDYRNFMNGRFPGLEISQPIIYSKLENYQFYKSKSNEWLVQFNELCKENKHERLSPQTKKEETVTRLSDESGKSMSWNEGVHFGPNGKISFKTGGKLIFGRGGSVEFSPDGPSVLGRKIDPITQNPNLKSDDKLEKITWVDFQFTSLGVSALSFLKKCIDNTKKVSKEFMKEIKT